MINNRQLESKLELISHTWGRSDIHLISSKSTMPEETINYQSKVYLCTMFSVSETNTLMMK
jgi:hypothetical protein